MTHGHDDLNPPTAAPWAASLSAVPDDLADPVDVTQALAALAAHSPDALLVLDDDEGRVLFSNPAAARLFRRSTKDLCGHPLGLPAYEKNGTPAELEILGPEGKLRVAEIHSVRVQWQGRRAHLTTLRDVTRRKLLERERVRDRRLLEAALEEARSFSAVVAHDLTEPARQVETFADLLSRQLADHPDQKVGRHLRFLRESATVLHSMLKQIRSFEQVVRSRSDLEPVALAEVVDDVRMMLHLQLEEATGRVSVEGKLPTITGDRVQLGRLLKNLVENSLKYRSEEPPRVILSARRRDDHWVLEVRDNGQGIPVGERSRVFELFRRACDDPAIPGTGMGLSLCRRIAEVHGGDMWIEDNQPRGAKVCVRLPARSLLEALPLDPSA